MNRRSLVTTIGSGVLALGLLIALVRIARLDITQLLWMLGAVKLLPCAGLVILAGLQVLLAAEKWRVVEGRIAPGAEHPRRLCFCFTAIGTAAGQVLPMQLATALARSFGSHLARGSGGVRGALATVFEQMFDLAVVALCGAVSLSCLWTGDLDGWTWRAVTAVALGLVLIGPTLSGAAAAATWLATGHGGAGERARRLVRRLADSGLFEGSLTRRLFALSVLRFVVLWLMAVATTQAVGLNISSLQLAAALPLVVLATALAMTPGGIGVNEWTFAAALTGFGVDFEAATQFALINRVLVAAAALMVAVAGVIVAQFAGRQAPSRPPSGAVAEDRPTAT